MAVPCAVTALKYVEAVTKGAGSGLRAHICHTPRTSATANARNASKRWAKVSCLACVTSNPALGVRLEFIRRDDAYRCRHFAVAQATILVAWHEQVAGTREDGVNLAHVPWNDHGIHVRPADEDAVDHVGRGEAQRHAAVGRQDDAARLERELRGDAPAGDLTVAGHARAVVRLGEFAAEMERLRVDPFDIARRVDVV